MSDEWIVVPGWERFQHYHDRDPVWIKLYLDLRSREEWRGLSLSARGLLASIWVEYAASGCLVKYRSLPSRVAQKVQRRTFDSLLEAGLLEVSASPPARPPARGETEKRREEPPLSPPQGGQGQILGEALPEEPPPSVLARAEPKPERGKRNGSRNGDAPPAPKTGMNVMADVLRWLQSPAFDAETMDEETVLEELGVRERKLQATVSAEQRAELLAVARQKREGYSEHWTGREP